MAKQNNINNALAGMSEAEARELLKQEAEKLKNIAIKLWRKYLDSNTPKQYIRTGNSERAIVVKNNFIKISENEIGIKVTFEDDLAYHDSVVYNRKKTHPKGHAIMLISEGWNATRLEEKIGYRKNFTRFKSTGYLYKVYKEYMSTRDKRVDLLVEWSGQFTK